MFSICSNSLSSFSLQGNLQTMETNCCKDVKLLVCLIIIVFGMGSWIAINGIWVELPILVDQLPEGWNLPSYMTIIIQIANIGPISYTIGHLLFPKVVEERPAVYLMVVVGSIASLLMAFLWQKTTFIGGVEHSTALLILMFFLSLVDCTSSVVFLPFMNSFKTEYMTSYYIGEGFSGLVPSLVSLGQGVGQIECVNTSVTNTTTNITEYSIQGVYLPALFPVKDFFLFIFAMMVLCGIAFLLLNHLPYCKSEQTVNSPNSSQKSEVDSYELNMDNAASSRDKFINSADLNTEESQNNQSRGEAEESHNTQRKMSIRLFLLYLILIGWVNALTNGVLPSVQSFACLPYGSQTYHLAVTLSNIANPLACFIAFFVPVKSVIAIGLYTLSGSLISAYILLLSAYSPEPPLLDTVLGPVLTVSTQFYAPVLKDGGVLFYRCPSVYPSVCLHKLYVNTLHFPITPKLTYLQGSYLV